MNNSSTDTVRRRYDRVAWTYDIREWAPEKVLFAKWRRLLWSKVEGRKILEVGVGTGRNFPYYPAGAEITAIDFSERMLAHARKKASKLGLGVRLLQMDAQKLEFEDATFDTVAATFVFCSVPDPVQGLKEIARVCVPGGKVILMEHVLSANRILARLMNLANPIVARLMGANINRRTVANVALSGVVLEKVTDLGVGIFKLIEARKA